MMLAVVREGRSGPAIEMRNIKKVYIVMRYQIRRVTYARVIEVIPLD